MVTAHIDGGDYGPGAEDLDDSPEYHAARNDGSGCGSAGAMDPTGPPQETP